MIRSTRGLAAAGLLALVFGLAGCERFRAAPRTVEVTLPATATAAQVEQSRAVLLARFQDRYHARFAQVAAQARGRRIVLTLRSDAPAADLEALARVRGRLRLGPHDGRPLLWFTEAAIVSAVPGLDEGGRAVLMVQLNRRAGANLHRYTAEHVGELLTFSLDGHPFSTATIQGAFGEHFQTSGLAPDRARELAAILQAGPLPVEVEAVEVREGAPAP
jgi:hypothetical protein